MVTLPYLRAKLVTPCASCNHDIAVGDKIFPCELEGYMHLFCAEELERASDQPLVIPVCKHWRLKGVCLFGASCIYRHPEASRPAIAAATTAMAAVKRRPNGRKQVRNTHRFGIFRRWLIETYGRERLKAGAGVLDVAAGKGDLSFEFLNLNSIQCTMVEPRPQDLAKASVRLKAGFFHWNRSFLRFIDRSVDGRELPQCTPSEAPAEMLPAWPPATLPEATGRTSEGWIGVRAAGGGLEHSDAYGDVLAPKHIRIVITPEMKDVLVSRSGDGQQPAPDPWKEVFSRAIIDAQHPRWLHAGASHEEGAGMHEPDDDESEVPSTSQRSNEASADNTPGANELIVLPEPGINEISDPDDAWRVLRDCSVLVGLHPDSCTEAIIDIASATGRPFAVVPCCVHASEHRHRNLNGKPVRLYDELLDYLQQKDPEIKRAQLCMEGRNTVLYRL